MKKIMSLLLLINIAIARSDLTLNFTMPEGGTKKGTLVYICSVYLENKPSFREIYSDCEKYTFWFITITKNCRDLLFYKKNYPYRVKCIFFRNFNVKNLKKIKEGVYEGKVNNFEISDGKAYTKYEFNYVEPLSDTFSGYYLEKIRNFLENVPQVKITSKGFYNVVTPIFKPTIINYSPSCNLPLYYIIGYNILGFKIINKDVKEHKSLSMGVLKDEWY